MKIAKELCELAHQSGGSFKTRSDRKKVVQRIARHLHQMNIQIRSVAHLKARHIKSYVDARLAQGIGKRSLQNEIAAVRAVLRKAGRHQLADSQIMSNKTLGIHGASRAGTRMPLPHIVYQHVFHAALQKDKGLAAAIQLARTFGLRSEEAVQSIHSLNTWHKELSQGKTHITVVFGTKGGRPRQTCILDRTQALHAVSFALSVAQQRNGKLIDKPSLKQAMTYWRNQTTRLGLTGAYSPHSLRYAWAQDAIRYYAQQGYAPKEAIAMTSMDLGHGDGRGRYVKYVYGLSEVQP